MSFKRLENHSQLLCCRDFANERLLLYQFNVSVELITNKIKQNYLKQRHLAPSHIGTNSFSCVLLRTGTWVDSVNKKKLWSKKFLDRLSGFH